MYKGPSKSSLINLGKQEVALGKQNKIWELLAQRISKKIQFLSKPWFMAYNFWIVTA